MHTLTFNVTFKDGVNYVDQWMKHKVPMQERYDFILDHINFGHCKECEIEITKRSVNMVLRFNKKDELANFLASNPKTKLDDQMVESSSMLITEE